MTRKLLTIKQASQELGVSVKTIRRWESQGKIESIRTSGGHRRFKLKEISPEKAITFKKILPYILASALISGTITYLLTNSHYQNQLNSISHQLDSYLNQVDLQEITLNSSHTGKILDSGIGVISPDNQGLSLVKSNFITHDSNISLSSDHQDQLKVLQIISGIGFIVSTKDDFNSPIYFNWEISR